MFTDCAKPFRDVFGGGIVGERIVLAHGALSQFYGYVILS